MSKGRKIDTLILIGNGFDIWQGISTSYSDFKKYYEANLSSILETLHIPAWTVEDKDETVTLSDVEMLYGDPFDPYYLDHDFWNCFENSLSIIDDQRVNLYFGKGKEDLERISQLAENARRILQEAFFGWISGKNIVVKEAEYTFPQNCFIINFNYTDTVRKRFGVTEDNDYHIHGEAKDKESIIVGHSRHPEYPMGILKSLGGRFEGLYYIEEALYESDKHVDDNYQNMVMNLAVGGVNLSNIRNVYILGHSFGEADYDYFRHLAYSMNGVDEDPFEGIPDWCLEYLSKCNETEAVFLNLEYALHHRERLGGEGYMLEMSDAETLSEALYGRPEGKLPHMYKKELEKAAMRARFLIEQGVRNAQFEFDFLDMMSEIVEGFPKIKKSERKKIERRLKNGGWKECRGIIKDVLKDRKNGKFNLASVSDVSSTKKITSGRTPTWHITYHSDADKNRVEDVMQRIHYDNYKMYPSIDECIENFKK